MKKVVTLGEIMLRLSPPDNKRFIQSESFDVCFGGAEANVAVSLANFGYDAEFITKVPNNPIGESAVCALRKHNVITKNICRGGERLGIYFLESGAAHRPSNVVYDRKNSAISEAEAEEFNFDEIFKDCDWFHFSGITPAISKKAEILTKKALVSAKKNGAKVSVDLNFRGKLWSEERAQEVMKPLMKYVDVCIGGREDAEKVLGFKLLKDERLGDEIDLSAYEKLSYEMTREYDFEYVITTLRKSRTASDNDLSACAYSKSGEFISSKTYNLSPIVDRVGGGDSFTGGIICGFLDGKSLKDTLEFGVAASALKHTVFGDFNLVTKEEVEKLAEGGSSGRVQR